MRKRSAFKKILFYIWQWTWGLPQNLLGLLLTVFWRLRNAPSFPYHLARVTCWGKKRGSMSLGMFLFLGVPPEHPHARRILCHEYGHSLQSLILGPFFLLVIGIPSFLWAGLPAFDRFRKRRKMSYYRLYPERWANRLGERTLKEKAPE